MTVTLYGHSDDLIEVEGDVNEEFNPNPFDAKESVLFSNGVLAHIQYENDGFWRINVIASAGREYTLVPGTDVDDDYSDRLTVDGDIEWVFCCGQTARAR